MKRIIALLVVIAFTCFVPMVKVTYPVMIDMPVVEEYTVTEPYTVWEEATIPYIIHREYAEWIDDGSWDYAKDYLAFTTEEYMDVFRSVTPGRWTIIQYPTTTHRTEMREVIRYRDVTRTRMVTKPTIMYKQKRVPLIQGFTWK